MLLTGAAKLLVDSSKMRNRSDAHRDCKPFVRLTACARPNISSGRLLKKRIFAIRSRTPPLDQNSFILCIKNIPTLKDYRVINSIYEDDTTILATSRFPQILHQLLQTYIIQYYQSSDSVSTLKKPIQQHLRLETLTNRRSNLKSQH